MSSNNSSRKRSRDAESEADSYEQHTSYSADESSRRKHARVDTVAAASSASGASSNAQIIDLNEADDDDSVVAPPVFDKSLFTDEEWTRTRKIPEERYFSTKASMQHRLNGLKIVNELIDWSASNQDHLHSIVASENDTYTATAPLGDTFGADVIIEVGSMYTDKAQFHGYLVAYRYMLMGQCEYFRGMFSGPWTEAQRQQAPYIVRKPNASLTAMKTVLRYLYSGTCGEVQIATLKECFHLAHEMMLDGLILDLAAHLFSPMPVSSSDDKMPYMVHFYDFFSQHLGNEFLVNVCLAAITAEFNTEENDKHIELVKHWEPSNMTKFVKQAHSMSLDSLGLTIMLMLWACFKAGILSNESGNAALLQWMRSGSFLPENAHLVIRNWLQEPFQFVRWGHSSVTKMIFLGTFEGKKLVNEALVGKMLRYHAQLEMPFLAPPENIEPEFDKPMDGTFYFSFDSAVKGRAQLSDIFVFEAISWQVRFSVDQQDSMYAMSIQICEQDPSIKFIHPIEKHSNFTWTVTIQHQGDLGPLSKFKMVLANQKQTTEELTQEEMDALKSKIIVTLKPRLPSKYKRWFEMD